MVVLPAAQQPMVVLPAAGSVAIAGQTDRGGLKPSRSVKDLSGIEQDIFNGVQDKLERYVWFENAFPLPTVVDAFWSEVAASKGYPALEMSRTARVIVCLMNIYTMLTENKGPFYYPPGSLSPWWFRSRYVSRRIQATR
jgi:hypothetical protein